MILQARIQNIIVYFAVLEKREIGIIQNTSWDVGRKHRKEKKPLR